MTGEHAKPEGWKNIAGWTAAGLMAALWLVAGLWKLSDISGFQVKLNQLLVPAALTLPATLAVAAGELFAGILLLRPAWRRLGGLFSTFLLLVFMVYVGVNYEALRGADCSCFPWIERAVGPPFFWGDGAMVVVSLIAAWFAPRMGALHQLKGLAIGVAALSVLALGWDKLGPAPGGEVPATIQVQGERYNLRQGRKLLYFFNPTCLHCLDVGLALSKYEFSGDFIVIPTQDPDLADGFLQDAELAGKVKLSSDLDLLKETFPFSDVPYAAAVEDGAILHRFSMIELEEPGMGQKLKELGIVN